MRGQRYGHCSGKQALIIGIDASRAYQDNRAGTENYSRELIEAMLALPEAHKHKWRLYLASRTLLEGKLRGESFTEIVEIPWRRLWTQGGLALEILKQPPDVLFIPAHTLPVLRPGRVRTVVTIHGLEYEYLPQYYQFPQKLYLNKSTEYAVRHADRLIAVSNWTKTQLVERLQADPNKIAVIHEGISGRIVKAKDRQFKPDYLRWIRHKYNLPKAYVLFVGTVQPRKNLVRLIEAFSQLILPRRSRQASPPRWHEVTPGRWNGQLVIAGKLGWMYDDILAAPKKFKVSQRVKFIGRVADPDLAAVYKMAKAFVWPSLMEGFGLPVLEAMSLGVPVICSNRGALPEVAGKAVLLVDPEDTAGITKAIQLVLTNQELREDLVEAGFRRAARFSWDKAAKKTLEVLTKKW